MGAKLYSLLILTPPRNVFYQRCVYLLVYLFISRISKMFLTNFDEFFCTRCVTMKNLLDIGGCPGHVRLGPG